VSLLLLALACTGGDVPPPPSVSGSDSTPADSPTWTPTDTAEPLGQLPEGFTRGDPIQTLGATETQWAWETLDAAQISEDRALVVANNGFVVVDIDTFEITLEVADHNGFHVEWDPSIQTAWVTTKVNEMWKVDVSVPDEATIVRRAQPWSAGSEDLDCENGRVLVSAHDDGAWLLDRDLETLAVFPATWAVGAGLVDGRAVITDADEVVLIDWSDPTDPIELDRLGLGVTGWDLDFDGTHVAVAQGADGVAILAVVDDALVLRGELPSPGGVYGVSLDGDYLWASAWSQIMLTWLGGDEPVMVGHEPSAESAMALGALSGGRVLVAEWKKLTLMERTDGVAGAEVDLSSELWWPVEQAGSQSTSVLNGGAEDLSLAFGETEGWTVDPAALTLGPGERQTLRLSPDGTPTDALLPWTSNDPDEPSGTLALTLADTTLGQPHPDFSLESYTPPNQTQSVLTQDDLLGRIAYIAWFSPG